MSKQQGVSDLDGIRQAVCRYTQLSKLQQQIN